MRKNYINNAQNEHTVIILMQGEGRKDKTCVKTSIRIVLFLVLLLLVLIAEDCYSSSSSHKELYNIPRHIQYSYTLDNPTNKSIKGAHFWIYAPVKQTPTQRCGKITSSHPYQLITDEYGNQILHYAFDHIPPFGSKMITIDIDLMLSENPNRNSVKNLNEYLLAEKYIESDNLEIKTTAQQLNAEDVSGTAKNIFQWVVDYMSCPGYILPERGALYAFHNRKGDCTEYMYLFTALCRAVGIPSRCLGGYVCSQNSILQFIRYHNWAEFYSDGTWRVADPHKNIFLQNQSHYIAFRIMKSSPLNPISNYNRFHLEGQGLHVRMN